MAGRGGLGWKPAQSLTPGPSRPVSFSVTWGWQPAPERLEDGGGGPRHLPGPPQVQARLSRPLLRSWLQPPACTPSPAKAPRRGEEGAPWKELGIHPPSGSQRFLLPSQIGVHFECVESPDLTGPGSGQRGGREDKQEGCWDPRISGQLDGASSETGPLCRAPGLGRRGSSHSWVLLLREKI